MGGKSSKSTGGSKGGGSLEKTVGGGGSSTAGFKMFDKVRIAPNVIGGGKRAEIVGKPSSAGFYVVRFGSGMGSKTRSYHESDLIKVKTREK